MVMSLGEVSYDIVSVDKTAPALDSAGDRARKVGKIAGAAMTGIGVGMIALTDSAKKTNATIRLTALQLGVTAEEMRELTLATTNVTFPIEEVTASFDLLTRAGMTNQEEIAATATAYDTLGDAIGKTATEVTGPMVTAMKTFGLEMTAGADYTDKMTYLLRNTTLEMDNFSSIIAKIPPDIVKMGLTMDDTIALLGLMEESGLSGAVATREFQKAITAARKSGEPLNEVLGFTGEQVDEYKDKLEGATGMTKEYADMANTQYGTMDKLRHAASELTLKYGSMLEPLDALGPAMATLGPIMIMASTMNWGMVTSLGAHAIAAWAAIAPYLLIIAPIIAVIAILYVLEKKFGVVTKAIELAREGFSKAVDFLKGMFTRAIEGARDIVGIFGDKLLFLLGPIGAVIYAIKNWEEIWTFITGLFGRIFSFFSGIYGKFREAGKNIIQALIDGIKALINKPAELIQDALGKVRNLLPFSPAKEGPLAKLPNWESYLVEPMKAARISPSAMFEPGIGGERRGGGAERPPIEVKIETTIYNYSDVEEMERMVAEAVQRGIHDTYGTR